MYYPRNTQETRIFNISLFLKLYVITILMNTYLSKQHYIIFLYTNLHYEKQIKYVSYEYFI